MRVLIILFVCVAIALAGPARNGGQRIIGGQVTTIDQYPFAAVMLRTANFVQFTQDCGGSILNERSILSAAHCFLGDSALAHRWRIRVGSSFAHSGGVEHVVFRIINHPLYNRANWDNDISVVQITSFITFSDVVKQASIAGPNYFPADNSAIWAIGWGLTTATGSPSEQLQEVELRVVNQEICNQRYGGVITNNMLCTGLLDEGGRDACSQDSGGPQIHNNIVVGVTSFGAGCALPQFPGVTARVSSYTSWILENV